MIKSYDELINTFEYKRIRKLLIDINKLQFAKAQNYYSKMVKNEEVRI